jgi:predicted hydrolase (HD superfamily)
VSVRVEVENGTSTASESESDKRTSGAFRVPRDVSDVVGRLAASVNVPCLTSTVDHMQMTAAWAEGLARKLLEHPLPRRWAHVQGVAARARSIAIAFGADAGLLEAAAWLHDIGYSPELAKTGFHPLDGARYLRDAEQADPLLCRLVANHSCAILEASERGLADELSSEFPPADLVLNDALAYCDLTTTPDGFAVSVQDRISEIAERYGPEDIVTRFIRKAEPHLISSVARTACRVECATR